MFWGFMTVYRNVDAYFYFIQNLINSSISTHFGRRTMNNWTVYCHLTVVNSYIQWIQFFTYADRHWYMYIYIRTRPGSRKNFRGGGPTYNCGSAQIWKITIFSFPEISAILSFAKSRGSPDPPPTPDPPLDPRMRTQKHGIGGGGCHYAHKGNFVVIIKLVNKRL